MPASQTFSGSRAIFFVNAQEVAFAGGMSGSEVTEYEPIDVLNLLEVREHVPVAYKATLNAQIYRNVGNSLKKQGLVPIESEIITSDDFTVSIQDVVTLQTIALFQGVRGAGHTFDITARGVVQSNVDFVVIRLKDEFENPI